MNIKKFHKNKKIYITTCDCDKDLDIIHKDTNWEARQEVAKQGHDKDLDILVHDLNYNVRTEVAKHGRPQDLKILIHDSNGYVKDIALRKLFEILNLESLLDSICDEKASIIKEDE